MQLTLATMIVSCRTHLTLDGTGPSADALGPAELGSTEELWEGAWVSPKLDDLDAVVIASPQQTQRTVLDWLRVAWNTLSRSPARNLRR